MTLNTVDATEALFFQILGDFLASILDPAVTIVRGQDNRVAQPAAPDHVVMWPLFRNRLTIDNLEELNDVAFHGSMAGKILTVSSIIAGEVYEGALLYANGVQPNTVITSFGTGSGGPGTYNVSVSQTLNSTVIQAGTKGLKSAIKVTVQIDVHGPASANNAHIIQTMLQDDVAYQALMSNTQGIEVAPLQCDDPRQIPFVDGEQQVEEKWIVQAVFQINPVVNVAQQFADALSITTNVVE